MERFEVTEVMNLNGGTVELDEDQARRRIHNIVEVDKGVYEIVNPIQFKVGETFGYDGEVNKALAHAIISTEDAEVIEVDAGDDFNAVEVGNDACADVYPKHLGGPWYELSNGEKVKGKEDAEDAELALCEE